MCCLIDIDSDAVENGSTLFGGGDHSDFVPRHSVPAGHSCASMYRVFFCICIYEVVRVFFCMSVFVRLYLGERDG